MNNISSIAAQIAMREPRSLPVAGPGIKTAAEIVRDSQRSDDPMDVAKNVSSLAADPDKMTEALEAIGSEFNDDAPTIAQDLRNTVARAVFFLAGKAPKPKVVSPGMPEMQPPRSEYQKYSRYVRAINDPTSLLDEADTGTLTPESVEAVRIVYPSLYAQMQAALAERVQNMPKVPYRQRMQLSALLGQDMTGTLSPSMVSLAQSAYSSAKGEAPKQQMPVYRAKGLNLASREGRETAAWKEAQQGARR